MENNLNTALEMRRKLVHNGAVLASIVIDDKQDHIMATCPTKISIDKDSFWSKCEYIISVNDKSFVCDDTTYVDKLGEIGYTQYIPLIGTMITGESKYGG
jgi:hypothetical protein